MVGIIVIMYLIGVLVIILPELMSNRIKLKARCVGIKKSLDMECPIFEIYYDNKTVRVCNENYIENSGIIVGDIQNIYVNKNDLNDFYYNYVNNKTTLIVGIMILIFASVILIITKSFDFLFIKSVIAMIFMILGLSFLTYSFIKIVSQYRTCNLILKGKVVSFKQKTEESYDNEYHTSKYNKYSPIYEFTYKNKKYKVSNSIYKRYADKLLKQNNQYKIRINSNSPTIFMDKLFIISNLIISLYGILLNMLGLMIFLW